MFSIDVFGLDPDDLDPREKEVLAVQVHESLQENFGLQPTGVDVEGYRGDA